MVPRGMNDKERLHARVLLRDDMEGYNHHAIHQCKRSMIEKLAEMMEPEVYYCFRYHESIEPVEETFLYGARHESMYYLDWDISLVQQVPYEVPVFSYEQYTASQLSFTAIQEIKRRINRSLKRWLKK